MSITQQSREAALSGSGSAAFACQHWPSAITQ